MNRALCLLVVCGFACGGDDDGLPDVGVDAAGDAVVDGAAEDASEDTEPPVDMCTTEGEMRVAACGMCGTQSQRCESSVWTGTSECLGQGECSVGQVETEESTMCGRRQRICLDGCTWGEWNVLQEEGECEAGVVEEVSEGCPVGASFSRTCSASCEWETDSICRDECGVNEMPEDRLREMVCIPGAEVMLNATSDADSETFPVRVSSFRIMRYYATEEAVERCLEDGECTEPVSSRRLSAVFYEDANDYCEALGMRVPTLAEVVLATRGPSPRTNRFPWWNGESGDASNDFSSCEYIFAHASQDCSRAEDFRDVDPVAPWRWPSPFGLVLAGRSELASDLHVEDLSADYRSTPPRLDPAGPEVGDRRTRVRMNVEHGLANRERAIDGSFRCVEEL